MTQRAFCYFWWPLSISNKNRLLSVDSINPDVAFLPTKQEKIDVIDAMISYCQCRLVVSRFYFNSTIKYWWMNTIVKLKLIFSLIRLYLFGHSLLKRLIFLRPVASDKITRRTTWSDIDFSLNFNRYRINVVVDLGEQNLTSTCVTLNVLRVEKFVQIKGKTRKHDFVIIRTEI